MFCIYISNIYIYIYFFFTKTGEMEVKNPLFHDDPTPATPAQNNKEEDHI